jgi:hypothetical protein
MAYATPQVKYLKRAKRFFGIAEFKFKTRKVAYF